MPLTLGSWKIENAGVHDGMLGLINLDEVVAERKP